MECYLDDATGASYVKDLSTSSSIALMRLELGADIQLHICLVSHVTKAVFKG